MATVGAKTSRMFCCAQNGPNLKQADAYSGSGSPEMQVAAVLWQSQVRRSDSRQQPPAPGGGGQALGAATKMVSDE